MACGREHTSNRYLLQVAWHIFRRNIYVSDYSHLWHYCDSFCHNHVLFSEARAKTFAVYVHEYKKIVKSIPDHFRRVLFLQRFRFGKALGLRKPFFSIILRNYYYTEYIFDANMEIFKCLMTRWLKAWDEIIKWIYYSIDPQVDFARNVFEDFVFLFSARLLAIVKCLPPHGYWSHFWIFKVPPINRSRIINITNQECLSTFRTFLSAKN